jgi:hypothetical protein
MFFEGRGQGIEPVRCANEIFEGFIGVDVFDPERDNGYALTDRAFYFPDYLLGFIGIGREHEHHDLARANCIYDRLAPLSAGHYIPRCDPAPYAADFQRRAYGVGYGFIFSGVTDKNIVSHLFSPSPPEELPEDYSCD